MQIRFTKDTHIKISRLAVFRESKIETDLSQFAEHSYSFLHSSESEFGIPFVEIPRNTLHLQILQQMFRDVDKCSCWKDDAKWAIRGFNSVKSMLRNLFVVVSRLTSYTVNLLTFSGWPLWYFLIFEKVVIFCDRGLPRRCLGLLRWIPSKCNRYLAGYCKHGFTQPKYINLQGKLLGLNALIALGWRRYLRTTFFPHVPHMTLLKATWYWCCTY